MPRFSILTAAALALWWAGGSACWAARPDAAVEALQMPAWLERNATRVPLAPAMTLAAGDTVVTGGRARVRLRLADGSMVKLGENARFGLAALAQGRSQPFRATLDVIEGAFRFTTTLLYRYRGERDVQVRFSTVTAGIRGTDLWGKSTDTGDVVALLEGNIVLTRPDAQPLTLDRPLTLYQAPRTGDVPPLQTLSSEQLAGFAAETEIGDGAGAVEKRGRWQVVAAQAGEEGQAAALRDLLRDAGYAATVRPIDGGRTLRVLIEGFATQADATALAARLRTEFGLDGAVPSRR